MKPTLQAIQDVHNQLQQGARPTPDLAHWRRLSPEAQQSQAELIHAFRNRSIPVDGLDWRQASLPRVVQLQLEQHEVLASPELLQDRSLTPLLFNALITLPTDNTADVSTLFQALLSFNHPRITQKALELLDAKSATFDPTTLLHLYAELLPTSVGAEACVRFHQLGGAVSLGLCNADGPIALAAVRAVGEQGSGAYLRHLLDDAKTPIATQVAAIQTLGLTGVRSQLEPVLGHCLAQVEHLAEAASQFLCFFRERGFFLQDSHLSDVFELARHTTVPLLGLTTHLWDARRDYLLSIPTDDLRLLSWLPQLDAAETGLTEVWINLLNSRRPSIRLEALRRLTAPEHREAEQAVLALLPAHEPEVRRCLATIGTVITVDFLFSELRGDTRLTPAWIDTLVDLIADDDPRVDELIAHLDAHATPSTVIAKLCRIPRRGAVQQLLRYTTHNDANDVLLQLCQAGTRLVLPQVIRILGQYTGELTVKGITDNPWTFADTGLGKVPSALQGLGRALQQRGALTALVGHTDTPGDALLQYVLLRAIQDYDIHPGHRVVLLQNLPWPARVATHTIIQWHRSRHSDHRREVLALMATSDDKTGVAPYVLQSLEATDEAIQRAAMLASSQLGLKSAAPQLLLALEHGNMALKRQAATGLQKLGNHRAVPALVRWLSVHDNRGFRADLLQALSSVAPKDWQGHLLAAKEASSDPRSRELLTLAAGKRPSDTIVFHSTVPSPVTTHPIALCTKFEYQPTPENLARLLQTKLLVGLPALDQHLARMLPLLLDVLATPVSLAERDERALHAKHLLDWLQYHPPTTRKTRLDIRARLRSLPTIPMGNSRWFTLQKLGAVRVRSDLEATLNDCERTGKRAHNITGVLAGFTSAQIDDYIHTERDGRDYALTVLLDQHPIDLPNWHSIQVKGTPTTRPKVSHRRRIQLALAEGRPIPPEWSQVPDLWKDVLSVSPKRLPHNSPNLLRGLFLDGLSARKPTKAWQRWTLDTWGQRPPTEIRAWLKPATAENTPRTLSSLYLSSEAPHDPVTAAIPQRLPSPPPLADAMATQSALIDALQGDKEQVRRALRSLTRFPGPQSTKAVLPLLRDRQQQMAALRCLKVVAERSIYIESVQSFLDDRDPARQQAAIRILGFMRHSGSVPVFVRLLVHRLPTVRAQAVQALLLQPDLARRAVLTTQRRARPDRRDLYDRVLSQLD